MVDNLFCHADPAESWLLELVDSLGFMLMEPLGDLRYRVVGKTPDWFKNIFGPESLCGDELTLENLSPFAEHFGPVAEQFWRETSSPSLKSGPWTESDSAGQEFSLELVALMVAGRPTMLLQLLGRDHAEKREILQHLREKGLDYEVLFKTQRALRIAHDLLLVKQRKLKEDLAAAAEIQRRFLPTDMPRVRNVNTAFKFRPCSSIAGDMFNVLELDEDHIAIFLFDVSGHGAPAAMMAVSVCQMLQPHSGFVVQCRADAPHGRSITPPRRVLENLDLEFPLERFDKYFTIFYGILDRSSNLLTYSNAGHPMPLVVHQDGSIDALEEGGTIIGLGGIVPFEQGQILLKTGDKLVLFSDGLTEFENESGDCYGMDRLKKTIVEHHREPVVQLLESVQNSLSDFAGAIRPQDDMSLLGLEITQE